MIKQVKLIYPDNSTSKCALDDRYIYLGSNISPLLKDRDYQIVEMSEDGKEIWLEETGNEYISDIDRMFCKSVRAKKSTEYKKRIKGKMLDVINFIKCIAPIFGVVFALFCFLFWICIGNDSVKEECKKLCANEGTATVLKCEGNAFTGNSYIAYCVVNDTEKGVMKLVVKARDGQNQ